MSAHDVQEDLRAALAQLSVLLEPLAAEELVQCKELSKKARLELPEQGGTTQSGEALREIRKRLHEAGQGTVART